jgi:dienelactone hydrolase
MIRRGAVTAVVFAVCGLVAAFAPSPREAAASILPPGTPQGLLGYVPTYDDPMPAYAWEGKWQSREVYIPSKRTGAALYATVFAPRVLPHRRLPAVVILPGSIIGTQANYGWAGRDLAGHGYIALTIDPEGEGHSQETAVPPCQKGSVIDCGDLDQPAFFSTKNWIDALETGIDYIISPRDPFHRHVDPAAIGAAGHSLGAAVVSQMQSVDHRIKAIVAWDNLDGGPSDPCNRVAYDSPGATTTTPSPRVPALGEGSETCETEPPPTSGKLHGFESWRAHRISSMEVVFAGTQHLSFGQGALNGLTGTSTQLEHFAYYMRAWFDLFLRHETGAVARLMTRTVAGTPRPQILSTKFTSAAYLPRAHIDCNDLARCR